MQLSRDHSVVAEMVERGEITPEEAKVHPHRHYITRALGTGTHVTPEISRFERHPNDIWLLCSDGLSNYIEEDELRHMLTARGDWPRRVTRMVETALRRGGSDNITVLVITSEGGAV